MYLEIFLEIIRLDLGGKCKECTLGLIMPQKYPEVIDIVFTLLCVIIMYCAARFGSWAYFPSALNQ